MMHATATAEGTMTRPQPLPSPTQKLAATLFVRARHALAQLPPGCAEPCLLALEAFVQAPGPAAFLRAHHLLAATLADHLSKTVFSSNQERAFTDGLTALDNVAVIPESDIACLQRDLPIDGLTGARLADLATLLQVWRELAGRTDEELDRMRALRASSRPNRRAKERA